MKRIKQHIVQGVISLRGCRAYKALAALTVQHKQKESNAADGSWRDAIFHDMFSALAKSKGSNKDLLSELPEAKEALPWEKQGPEDAG